MIKCMGIGLIVLALAIWVRQSMSYGLKDEERERGMDYIIRSRDR